MWDASPVWSTCGSLRAVALLKRNQVPHLPVAHPAPAVRRSLLKPTGLACCVRVGRMPSARVNGRRSAGYRKNVAAG